MQPSITQTILHDRLIAYAITDRQLRVIELNDAPGIFGVQPAALLGQRLSATTPELVGTEAALDDILNGTLPRLQLPWVNRELPDTKTAYLIMVILPWRGADGEIGGVLYIIQDLTAMGRLEQRVMQHRNELRLLQGELERQNMQLAAANVELRKLAELRSAFVSIAAHELRTPLTSIQGYLELLQDGDAGPLTERQNDYLDIIANSAQRLQHITKDLLDMTRLETGRLELILNLTDVRALVEAVVREQAPQQEAKSQRLTISAPPDLPPALADAHRTAQIIGNLLSNASKYSPAGSEIVLALTCLEEEGVIQFAISDTGIGISPEDQERIFSPFFRARQQESSDVTGTGLGLYIARALVELHGGRIWLESAPQRGSTFFFTLPLAQTRAG